MALNLANDAKWGKLAILMNQSLFGVGASSAATLEAQVHDIENLIPFFTPFATAENTNGKLALWREIAITLKGPAFVGKSPADEVKLAYHNLVGKTLSDAEANALLTGTGGNAAHVIANLIWTEAFTATDGIGTAANLFLSQVVAGTAVFGQPLIHPNHAPTDVVDKADNDHNLTGVVEHPTDGATVGTVKAVDADASDSFTYTITGGDTTHFAINATTGEITTKTGASAALDAGNYTVNVKATDASGASVTKTITITLDTNPVLHNISVQPNQQNNGTAGDDNFISAASSLTDGTGIHGNGGTDEMTITDTGGRFKQVFAVNSFQNGYHSTDFTSAFFMDGVQTIKVQNNNLRGHGLAVDLTNVVDATNLVVDGSHNDVTFFNIQAAKPGHPNVLSGGLTITDDTSSCNVGVNFDHKALTSPTDALTVNMDGTEGSNNIGTLAITQNDSHGIFQDADLEQIDFVTSGDPSTIDEVHVGDALTKITVSGSGDLTIGYEPDYQCSSEHPEQNGALPLLMSGEFHLTDYNNNLNIIDTTGVLTGTNIKIYYNNTYTGDVSYEGGAGNDWVDVGSTLQNGYAGFLHGGGGDDTLVLNDWNDLPNGPFYGNVTGFEHLAFEDGISGSQTLHVNIIDGLKAAGLLDVSYVIENYANVTFDGLGSHTDHTLDITPCEPNETITVNLIGDGHTVLDLDKVTLNLSNPGLTLNMGDIHQIGELNFNLHGGTGGNTYNIDWTNADPDNLDAVHVTSDGSTLHFNWGPHSGQTTPDLTLFDGGAANGTTFKLDGINVDVQGAGATIITADQHDFIVVRATDGGTPLNPAGSVVINGGAAGDTFVGAAETHNTFVINTTTNAAAFTVTSTAADADQVSIEDAADITGTFRSGVDSLVFTGGPAGTATNFFVDNTPALVGFQQSLAAANADFQHVPGKAYVALFDAATNDVWVFGDTNHDGFADAAVELVGVADPNAGVHFQDIHVA